MEKITIEKVNIKLFRNIKDKEYTLNSKNTAFEGKNKLGKTNILNAIFWCLCGCDLENNATDTKNVPFDLVNSETADNVLDVEVCLNVGVVKRVSCYENNSLKQTLYINGVKTETLRAGETLIDDMLKILPLTINQPKGFYARRLLLNPLYFTQVSQSSLREFFIKHYLSDSVSDISIVKGSGESIEKLVTPLLKASNDSLINVNIFLDNQKKEIKKEMDSIKCAIDYIKKYLPTGYMTHATELLKQQKEQLVTCEEQMAVVEQLIKKLNRKYQSEIEKRFTGLKIALIEKGVGEDVYKNVCYPYLLDKDLPFDKGSTSERIMLGVKFVNKLIDNYGLCHLPLFIDESETLDIDNLNKLNKESETQLLLARVNDTNTEIKMREL